MSSFGKILGGIYVMQSLSAHDKNNRKKLFNLSSLEEELKEFTVLPGWFSMLSR